MCVGGSKNVSVGPCNPNDAFLLKFHKTKIAHVNAKLLSELVQLHFSLFTINSLSKMLIGLVPNVTKNSYFRYSNHKNGRS